MVQFRRLARQQGWEKGSDEYMTERRTLQIALVLQFNQIYGESETDIEGWRMLCTSMRIDPIPETVTECKKVSLKQHNI